MATQEELLRENTRALRELTKLLKEQVREESDKGNERKDTESEIANSMNQQVNAAKELVDVEKQLNEEIEQFEENLERVGKRRLVNEKKYQRILEKEKELKKQLEKASKEQEKIIKEQLKDLKETKKELQEQLSGWSKLKNGVGEFTKRVGQAYRGIKQMSSALNTAAMDFQEFDASVLKLDNAKKAAFNIDKLAVELKRSTGLSGDFVKRIQEMEVGMEDFAMMSEDGAKAFTQLQNSVSDFSRLNRGTQNELVQTAYRFSLLGVSVEDTSKVLETGTKTLGMSTEETNALQENLAQTAIAIGVSPQRMVQGFSIAAPRLAAHGRDIEKVFKGLALQSKATGVSIEGLIGIAQGFDTFESAAQKTAQLNAMFGTQLNSVQLLNATEEERIDLIKQSLAATGKSVDQLGRYEVKSLAQILGTDDASVRRMLGATDDIFADLEDKAAGAGEIDLLGKTKEVVDLEKQRAAIRQRDAEMVGTKILDNLREQIKYQATNEEHIKGMAKAAELAAGSFNAIFEGAKEARGTFKYLAGATAALDLTDKTAGTGMSFLGGVGDVFKAAGAGYLLNKLTMPGGGAGGGGMLSRLKGLIPGGGAAGAAGGAGSGGGMLSRVGGFFKGGGAGKLLRGAGAAGGVLTTGMGISDIFTKKGVAQGKGASNAIKGMMLTAGSLMGPSGTPLLIGSGVIELLQSFGADTKIADYIYDTFGGGTGEDLTNVGTMFKAAPTPNAPSITPSAAQAQSSAQIMNTRTSQTASNLPDKIILSVDGQQFSAKIVKEGLNSLKKVETLN